MQCRVSSIDLTPFRFDIVTAYSFFSRGSPLFCPSNSVDAIVFLKTICAKALFQASHTLLVRDPFVNAISASSEANVEGDRRILIGGTVPSDCIGS